MDGEVFPTIIFGLGGALIGVVVLMIIDGCNLRCGETPFRGSIVGHGYTASSTHVGTGVGPAIGGNGGVAVTTVVTTSPEKWTALVRVDDDTISVEVDSKEWTSLKDGDSVLVWPWYGKLTGFYHENTLQRVP